MAPGTPRITRRVGEHKETVLWGARTVGGSYGLLSTMRMRVGPAEVPVRDREPSEARLPAQDQR